MAINIATLICAPLALHDAADVDAIDLDDQSFLLNMVASLCKFMPQRMGRS
jgi:hypothetical protein